MIDLTIVWLTLRNSLRLMKMFEAKRVLFQEQLRLSDERAESSEGRGCVLDVRKDADGIPVLVEINLKDIE